MSTPSYVQSTPVKSEYRESQPTTVTSNDGSTVTYGKPRVVRKYVDHSSRRSFRGGEEVPTSSFQVRNEAHVENIVSTQPTTYVQSTPQTTYVQSTPQTYTQPSTTTYVESTPQTGYTVSKKKSTTFQDAQFGEVQTNGGLESYGNVQTTTEGYVSKKKVIVRDGDGNIIEEYEEDVHQ